jgi:hypothetical protein
MVICIQFGVKGDFQSRRDWAFREKENLFFNCRKLNFVNSDVGWKYSTVLHVQNWVSLTSRTGSEAIHEVQEGTIVRPHQEYVTGVLR